ncbi:MAG: 3-oxoacyl-[acyl-carrier protein] reductase [Paraglaciecola psychrophila]|jgi:3-oxoacyl-[acyl-carrier protein] reductase
MDLKLNGKKALVLGGTRGIGRAIVENLISEGVEVALCARNDDQVQLVVSELLAKGAKVSGAAVDIADAAALRQWVAEAAAQLGGIDILVSNASAMATGNSAEEWQASLSIDILGLVNASEVAMPFLEQAAARNGDAAIISIGSIMSNIAAEPSAYGAIKGALVHCVKGLAKAQAHKHIRANIVSPGTVYFKGGAWDMIEQNMPDFFHSMMAKNPMGRMATAQEIANAAVFLASPLSGFTTGTNMVVDGAFTESPNY